MRRASLISVAAVTGSLIVPTACSESSAVDGPGITLQCVSIAGSGTTTGDRNKLRGRGEFRFNGEVRPAEVGVYFFEMVDAENGGVNVSTQYQFIWDNGDSFLTKDVAFFEPTLEPDNYKFSVRMTIVAGTGMFGRHLGERPLDLSATVQFGPPAEPGGAKTAHEEFSVAGQICDS